MARLLYIKANPKVYQESLTYCLSETFIKEYQQAHPKDDIEVLDLYQTIMPIMDYERLAAYSQGVETEIKQMAMHFKSYDKCVIAAPVWNHSFPSMLKVYLDNIVYRHVTFTYQEGKMMGLCSDMKVMYIASSAQVYEGDRKGFDHNQSQIRAIFDLIGVKQVECVGLFGRSRFNTDQLNQEVEKLQRVLAKKAQTF
ncbi:MAG: NAD(P)H-dependent oxidoreductase [Turicibacter sp.]|nr:NAD(P)H-dependent oxidoreductase [Turicibacter sp.]